MYKFFKKSYKKNEKPTEAKVIQINQTENISSLNYLLLSFQRISDLIDQGLSTDLEPNDKLYENKTF